MRLCENKVFQCTAGELWTIIRDPGNMPAWNPKCISADSPPRLEVGSEFRAIFQMSGPTIVTMGQIIEFVPNSRLLIRYSFADKRGKTRTADESFDLVQGQKNCRLTHSLDLSASGLPFWARMLGSFISLFGYRAGDSPLDGIEDILGPGV